MRWWGQAYAALLFATERGVESVEKAVFLVFFYYDLQNKAK